MFLYHATPQDWLRSGATKLAFHQYVRPENEPWRDHAPLNRAVSDNPGKSVYRAFFLEEEHSAIKYGPRSMKGYVVLRLRESHSGLAGFTRADDDRDAMETAHMWFRVDSVEPINERGRKVHPTWGIPFSDIEILDRDGGEWQPLNRWLAAPLPATEVIYDDAIGPDNGSDAAAPR